MKYQPRPQDSTGSEAVRIGEAVHTALEDYFRELDGLDPNDLYDLVMSEVERPLLECVMYHCDGNQTKAARILGINRGTLRKKLKIHEVN